VPAPDVAEARAEEVLAAHLTPDQRAEWAAVGRITIVKRGLVWSVLLLELAKMFPLVILLVVPGWRVAAVILFMTVVVGSKAFWLPRIALASTQRREWLVSAHGSPVVNARGRQVRFCALFREQLPAADRVLAWKHLLEMGEAHFLRKANIKG
jgi:hypothetical protein